MVKIVTPGGIANFGQGMPRQNAYSALEGMPYRVTSDSRELYSLEDRDQVAPTRLQTIMHAQTLKPVSRAARLQSAGIPVSTDDITYDRDIHRTVTPYRGGMIDPLTFKSGRSTRHIQKFRPIMTTEGRGLVKVNMGFNRY